MTAPPDWADHLAAVEAAGPTAVRAHLQAEHDNALRELLATRPNAAALSVYGRHRLVHHQPGEPSQPALFPTEAPA